MVPSNLERIKLKALAPNRRRDKFRTMKKTSWIAVSVFASLLTLGASVAEAAPSKTYQVTGPVTGLNAKTITVTKGKEKFEVARVTETDFPADLKIGDKVTVQYFMTATTIEKKPAGKK
jgi:hypothetical protein